ncbi:MAG: hypothetical protein HZB15_14365 [Actinobacteria bacterium]|nr:hypothetical protein [Actinomycetota bacterium]
MTTLPPPPPPPLAHPAGIVEPAGVGRPMRPPRPGELTAAWRGTFIVGWGCVLVAMVAIGRTAWKMGLSTWWTGPRFEPQLLPVLLIPSLVSVVLIVLAARNARFLPYWGIVGAIALAAIATGDLGRFDGLAAAEFTVAGAALLVSLASFAGVLRRADPDPRQ